MRRIGFYFTDVSRHGAGFMLSGFDEHGRWAAVKINTGIARRNCAFAYKRGSNGSSGTSTAAAECADANSEQQ